MKKKLCAVLLLTVLAGLTGSTLDHHSPTVGLTGRSQPMAVSLAALDLEHGSW